MKIRELFRRDIDRIIEEVIKVDVDDENIVVSELDEYVATEHILEELETVLEAYQESIRSPNETCTVWVSGFFGSGKSSWAKVLGYLLWNPVVVGERAAERFFGRTSAPRQQALLNTIHAQAPTLAVLLNLATGSNVVAREGESVVLPVCRALLDRLDYSRNFTIAELEYTMEGDGKLEDFENAFASIVGKPWKERRYTALAKRDAMKAVDAVYGDGSGLPGWARELEAPDINADWFSTRALNLLKRRGGDARRLTFIVDEAGQYIARSVQRMLDLQGLAEAFQKRRGSLWLVVTSQEKLNDVVDSLEAKQVELARAQARFPLRVDLLPSDIDEVTGKRILDKTDEAQRSVREAIRPHRNQLIRNIRLSSPTRSAVPSEDELVRLYPLLPYQIQLLIDAVSVRRTQGGASPTVGGSNRTLIKHAQQLIAHPKHGLGSREVGTLVTLDRSFELLEELVPTSWRSEVAQVAARYGADSHEARVMKVAALCVEIPALPLSAENIAALLHSEIAGENQQDEISAAIARLVTDDRLRETNDGYKLQSPEQKNWEKDRRGIDLTPGASVRLRREMLKQALRGLTVTRGRTFKVEVTVEGERVVTGELPLHIAEVDDTERDDLRAESRESAHQKVVNWIYGLASETWDALVDLHRSRVMVERRDTPNKPTADVGLLAEERERERRCETTALQRLTRDLTSGRVIFRGRIEDIDGTRLRPTAQRVLSERLDEIYPQLPQFTANLSRDDVTQLLRTTDLSTLPEGLREEGIGLVEITPDGYVLVTDRGPLDALVNEIDRRATYGNEATGAHLETHFAKPPYGAQVEVVQALCAAALRAGMVETIHQGQLMANAGDQRLDQVFGTLPKFRAAAFRPPTHTDVPLELRVDLAKGLEYYGQYLSGHSTEILADAVREAFGPSRETTVRVIASLTGIGIAIPQSVTRTQAIIDRLIGDDDVEVVTTAHSTWADLTAGSEAVARLSELLDNSTYDLRAARREAGRLPVRGLPDPLKREHAELVDLLAAGDLVDHAARIMALTRRLAEHRHAATQEAADRLNGVIDEIGTSLRREFNEVDGGALSETLRPIEQLIPPDDLTSVDASELEVRIDSARARAREATHLLEELRASGQLAWVRVGELIAEPITAEDEIDPVLDRIREAIATELAEGKQVRLQ